MGLSHGLIFVLVAQEAVKLLEVKVWGWLKAGNAVEVFYYKIYADQEMYILLVSQPLLTSLYTQPKSDECRSMYYH